MKILYIDDNQLFVSSIKRLLNSVYVVDHVNTGREGLESARSIQYGLILLDLRLPDIDGIDVCRELRHQNIISPIVILSANRDPEMSAQLLNCGADDYIVKPFSGCDLQARIAALLRRSQAVYDEKIITVSDMTINLTRRVVSRSGVDIVLRRKEFDILEYLATNQGRVLTRAMILNQVWEAGTESWNNTIDVHIKYLRDKVDRPFGSSLIKTLYGVGYMMDSKK